MAEKKQFNSDDQDWLDVLGGWDIGNVDEATRAEAEALRNVLISDDENKTDELKTKRAENALLKKLKDEGLIKEKKSYFNTFSLASVAASVIAVSITLSVAIDVVDINNDERLALESAMLSGGVSSNIPKTLSSPNFENEKKDTNTSNRNYDSSFRILSEIRRNLNKSDIKHVISREDKGWRILIDTKSLNEQTVQALIDDYGFEKSESGRVALNITYK